MYLISACLVGVNCRYNGQSATVDKLEKLVKAGEAIVICPELLGGLAVPRDCCEIVEDSAGSPKVISKEGKDFTLDYQNGAQKTLEIAKTNGINIAILKSKSPSCGYGKIYDGTFKSIIRDGNGLTAELLAANGITVLTEDELADI